MWEIVGSECLLISLVFGVEVHALVLMPNHLHLILTVPEQDLGVVMNTFMSDVTRASNRLSGRSGHLFGGPYFRSLINSSRYFGHALKYVYRNPVRANLCKSVEDYEFSTLHGLTGRSHLPFPLHFTRVGMELAIPPTETDHFLTWLNTPFPSEAEQLIQKGLRKTVFDDLKCRMTRKPHEILRHLI